MHTGLNLTIRVGSFLLLEKKNKILLIRRFNTGWHDGDYSLPAGHVYAGEKITFAIVREAKEELGISIHEKDLSMIHVMYLHTNYDYIVFFFKTNKWEGEPQNLEKDKCDHMKWYSLDEFPPNTLPFISEAIKSYRQGKVFSDLV